MQRRRINPCKFDFFVNAPHGRWHRSHLVWISFFTSHSGGRGPNMKKIRLNTGLEHNWADKTTKPWRNLCSHNIPAATVSTRHPSCSTLEHITMFDCMYVLAHSILRQPTFLCGRLCWTGQRVIGLIRWLAMLSRALITSQMISLTTCVDDTLLRQQVTNLGKLLLSTSVC